MAAPVVFAADLGGADPLPAAARFHAEHLPRIEAALLAGARSLVIRFDHAEEKPHRWRQQAVAALARAHVPARINAVAPARSQVDEATMEQCIAFLFGNEGVTGQLLLAG